MSQSAKWTKIGWRNAFSIASPEVLRGLVSFGSYRVQGGKGQADVDAGTQEMCFQEVFPGDIYRSCDVKGSREMGQVSNDLKLRVLTCQWSK